MKNIEFILLSALFKHGVNGIRFLIRLPEFFFIKCVWNVPGLFQNVYLSEKVVLKLSHCIGSYKSFQFIHPMLLWGSFLDSKNAVMFFPTLFCLLGRKEIFLGSKKDEFQFKDSTYENMGWKRLLKKYPISRYF